MFLKLPFLKPLFIILLACLMSGGKLGATNPNFQKDSLEITELLKSAEQKSLKNFAEACDEANKAIEIAKKLDNNILLVKAYRRIGYCNEENNRIENAASYYQLGLDLTNLVPDSVKIEVYYDWAIINKKLNHFKISRDYYNKTLSLALSIKNYQSAQGAVNGLGTLHEFLGELDMAIKAYLQSIEYANKCKNPKGSVLTLVNISAVYLKGKNFDLALANITKALNMASDLKDSTHLGYIYNTFGKILNEQGKFEEALNYHDKALKYYEFKGEKRYITRTLIHFSEVYLQKKDLNTAKQYLLKAHNNYKGALEFDDYPNLYLRLGDLYQKMGDNKRAVEALTESIISAKTRGFKEIVLKGNTILSQVYAQMGNNKLALEHLKTANIYGDSLFSEEKSRRFAEAQYKFDVERAEAQYKFEKELSEKRLQDIEIRQKNYWFVMFFIIFSAVIATLVYIVKMKSKSNIVLIQKNAEIKFQNERLEKSNEILHQFAYASAHDLKEPLRSISSFVHIIDRRYAKLLPPEASEYMNFVIGGVKRMESLLSALLEYSTVASEQEEVKVVTPLKQILNDVQQNLHSVIVEKNAIITVSGVLPSVWISRLHLTQLFQNLLSNSLKFSDKQPLISIKGKIQDEKFLITLQDNGIGMRTEYSDKIFRLFQRLSRSPQYEGTGIGLAICKNIVDNYNGKIWFESVEGVGTTFFISIPLTIVKFEKEIALNTEGILVN